MNYLDLHRENPLYDERLSLICSSLPHSTPSSLLASSSSSGDSVAGENYDMEINLKILHGYRGSSSSSHGSQQEKILYFEVTDENDYYFLYTLEIGETDFHNLKRDQRLIVDFNGFPKKFIDLIQLCQHSARSVSSSATPRAAATDRHMISSSMSVQSSQYFAKMDFATSVLSIIEMNEFNHVIHLCLQLRPGNDASIKSYLSSSLKLLQSRYELLKQDSENLNQEYLTLKRINREQSTDLRTIRETTDREVHSLATAHSEELNQLRQQHLEQLEASRQRWETERAEIKLVTDRTISELQAKLSSLDQSYSELSKERLELEYQFKQQNSELEKIRPECSFYKSSMTELQESLRIKDKERYQLEQELARSTARREALELQISDKEEIVQKSTSLKNASEQSRQEALKQVEVYSTALSALQEKFKAAVNEINKGNETLRRFQTETQSLKEKISSKNDIIRQQEKMVQEQKERLNDLNRKNLSLEETIGLLNQKRALLEREFNESKKQIQESVKVIQDNEKVITHLNEMLTDFQLGGTGAGAGRGMSSPSAGRYSSSLHRTPGSGGGYGTPVVTPYDGHDHIHHRYDRERDPLREHDHEEYSPSPAAHSAGYRDNADLTTAQPYPTPPSHFPSTSAATVPYSSRSPPTPPHQTQGQAQRKGEGSDMTGDYLFSEKRGLGNGKRDAEFDLLLTPNHTALPHQHRSLSKGGGSTPKGYYDGLLDIPVVNSAASASSRAAGVTPSRDPRSPGSSGKKPVYSWSLPGFGRDDDLGAPPSAAPPSRA